ncbi:hypothetical protein ACTNE0_12360, partial [Bacillota bacterium HCP3S3_E9]
KVISGGDNPYDIHDAKLSSSATAHESSSVTAHEISNILRRPTAVTLRNMQVFAGCHLKFANRPIRDDFGAGNASVFYNLPRQG